MLYFLKKIFLPARVAFEEWEIQERINERRAKLEYTVEFWENFNKAQLKHSREGSELLSLISRGNSDAR